MSGGESVINETAINVHKVANHAAPCVPATGLQPHDQLFNAGAVAGRGHRKHPLLVIEHGNVGVLPIDAVGVFGECLLGSCQLSLEGFGQQANAVFDCRGLFHGLPFSGLNTG